MRFKPEMEQLETRETPALMSKLSFAVASTNSILPPPDNTTPVTTTPTPTPAPAPTNPPPPPPVIP
jgi:hypothetical protein